MQNLLQMHWSVPDLIPLFDFHFLFSMLFSQKNATFSSLFVDFWCTIFSIGQPFNAKLAVVDLETPYYKGYHTVGLVPNLAAEAWLGIDNNKTEIPLHNSTVPYSNIQSVTSR
jgi:hypothetical protein